MNNQFVPRGAEVNRVNVKPEALHTPGPWTERYLKDYGRIVEVADGKLADVMVRGICGDESEANARLIASAPDLLSACEATREQFAAYIESDEPEGEDYEEALKALKLIDQAIARATGKGE